MPRITFYRQKRADGSIRTAVDVDGLTGLMHFQRGSEELDPALDWFVDVRCDGKRLPTDFAEARQWFLDHADVVRSGLADLAERLQVGLDFTTYPVEAKIGGAPRGIRLRIVVSALRRFTALTIATILEDLATHWESYLGKLKEVHAHSVEID